MKQQPTFQEFIYSLCHYWTQQGCVWSQPYDQPMGAGTFHPHTFFKAIGNNIWNSVYVQPCRRPVDGRYGKSPNRLQYYYQLQVFLKPAPHNILDIYLNSLQHVGIELKENDIALYEDNWKSPTLGAWGLGWEVRANGEEVTQFTYFQEFGGLPVDVVPCELTYGLERLYMYKYGYNNVMDIPFNEQFTYGDIFYENENEFSCFNFKEADTELLFSQFDMFEQKAHELCAKQLTFPAYDYVLQASHAFNLLDARGALSVTERQRFIGRVRECAKDCASTYHKILSKKKIAEPKFNKVSALKTTLPLYNSSKKSSAKKLTTTQKKSCVNILLEIGVEELPPHFQRTALKSLNQKLKLAVEKFSEQYSYNENFASQLIQMTTHTSISSRRIAIECKNVPKFTPEQDIELWGPAENIARNPDGTLTQAGLGFCKKQNINEKKATFKLNPKSNVSFLYAQKRVPACDFPSILIHEFKNMIYQLDAALKMRWLPLDIQEHEFVRPVRWLLCLVNKSVFPLEMFGVQSSSYTFGQRVLSTKPILINDPSLYQEKLKKAHVTADPQTREKSILTQIQSIIKKLGNHISLIPDSILLEKCIGISESPFMFLGQFNKKYLTLPPKLISSVLKEHMNYFSLWDSNTNHISSYYIGVANYKCADIETMIQGTQKVVTSRLEDGAFYFESDLKIPIQTLRDKLKNQVFQDNLGTLYDKSERLSFFARALANLINLRNHHTFSKEDFEILQEAGRHCKNDLKTGCVQEFPDDMQGVMGGVLVRHQNAFKYEFKSESVAQAIEEHYQPENAHAALPTNKYALTIALADKLDSLILFSSAGYEPKGSHDPFGLRRLGIAIARLLNIKHEQTRTLCIASFEELIDAWQTTCGNKFDVKKIALYKFFADRVKSILKEDFPTNNIDSISKFFIKKPVSICVPLLNALAKFLETPECLTPYKRARTMTQNIHAGHINPHKFIDPAEHKLYKAIGSVDLKIRENFEKEEFDLYFEGLASLNQPLAEFFDSVMVNDSNPEIRENRLQILHKIRHLYELYVDLSYVQAS